MRAEAIFQPLTVLALWTGAVLLLTGIRRTRAVQARRVSVRDFQVGEGAAVPPDVSVTNRNFMNLLEMPVLFYVVSLGFYVAHALDGAVLALAWGYVALRLIHSAIHLTFNRVSARFAVFAASNVVLLVMWIRFLMRVAWAR